MSISTFRNQSSQLSRREQEAALPIVTVHPSAVPGKRDGDTAKLESAIGEVVVQLRLDPRQRPDVAIYPKGRWGTMGGPNSLIRARETDSGGGAAYYDETVRIS